MLRLAVMSFLLLLVFSAQGQRFHIGVFGGLAAYNGDLTDRIFPRKVTNASVGITAHYELTSQLILRGGVTYAIIGGADRFSRDSAFIRRNLSFETPLFEVSAVMEYYLIDLDEYRFSPYGFIGLAAYHFNPYAYYAGQKVYLKPLSTEGQGLPGYTDRKPYRLTQLAIPFGAGVKYAINDRIRIGLEVGYRKLFTDYLDDVSTTYANPNDLLAAKGQLAVDISYRGDEVAGGNTAYPDKSMPRGRAGRNDAYYFTGIHLTYRLGNGVGGSFNGRRNSTGCPIKVY